MMFFFYLLWFTNLNYFLENMSLHNDWMLGADPIQIHHHLHRLFSKGDKVHGHPVHLNKVKVKDHTNSIQQKTFQCNGQSLENLMALTMHLYTSLSSLRKQTRDKYIGIFKMLYSRLFFSPFYFCPSTLANFKAEIYH